jgi:fructose-1-phosphate kinase PfkB-like protein
MKREKGERNQSKGTRVRQKSDGEILEPIYETAEDLLKDNENEFYINEDGNHDNKMETVACSHPPLTEESHHIIVSGAFV